ncbi:hypothetical protein [Leucobacter aridicollis]|uniref:hypothetical protein n=1 Tax=Leucobacter aridicollis TaxID=283878 RepID=UPI00163DB018|nr:hypothetical protein [Leucobacter aridicollis]
MTRLKVQPSTARNGRVDEEPDQSTAAVGEFLGSKDRRSGMICEFVELGFVSLQRWLAASAPGVC